MNTRRGRDDLLIDPLAPHRLAVGGGHLSASSRQGADRGASPECGAARGRETYWPRRSCSVQHATTRSRGASKTRCWSTRLAAADGRAAIAGAPLGSASGGALRRRWRGPAQAAPAARRPRRRASGEPPAVRAGRHRGYPGGRPVGAVLLDPGRDFRAVFGGYRRAPGVAALGDEPCALEHVQVPRDRGQADGEQAGKAGARAPGPWSDAAHHPADGRSGRTQFRGGEAWSLPSNKRCSWTRAVRPRRRRRPGDSAGATPALS